ncbi:MAG: metallophosphoesterase [Lachnospiraceae bacterium]
MIYFTSDFHFGHRGIIEMQNRPFSDIAEMNQQLICNYNEVVHKNDTVYILGDICHHMRVEDAENVISRMKGRKILVRGNHDKKYREDLFAEVSDFTTASINGVYLALMHYPMLSWPKKNSGSLQLHGHIHADKAYNLENLAKNILRYDVGVDANDFYPISIEQIKTFFAKTSLDNLSIQSNE